MFIFFLLSKQAGKKLDEFKSWLCKYDHEDGVSFMELRLLHKFVKQA